MRVGSSFLERVSRICSASEIMLTLAAAGRRVSVSLFLSLLRRIHAASESMASSSCHLDQLCAVPAMVSDRERERDGRTGLVRGHVLLLFSIRFAMMRGGNTISARMIRNANVISVLGLVLAFS